MSVNASGWTPRSPEATEGEAQTWTGNRASRRTPPKERWS
jgi:hypothetical protein